VLAEKEGVAVFVSSHLLSEMELMCDRAAIIQNGELVNIQVLNGTSGTDSREAVTFNVSPVDKAMAYLASLKEGYTPTVSGNEIEIIVVPENIPDIVEGLVREKIRVYGVGKSSVNLESKFLEVTGGNQIA
jgi:ABC-2 type transport system ATP-binding protein